MVGKMKVYIFISKRMKFFEMLGRIKVEIVIVLVKKIIIRDFEFWLGLVIVI